MVDRGIPVAKGVQISDTQVEKEVRATLAGWDDLSIVHHPAFWLIMGRYKGKIHVGVPVDPIDGATRLHEIALREEAAIVDVRKPPPETPLFVASPSGAAGSNPPAGPSISSVEQVSAEVAPDPLARIVPPNLDLLAQKQWASDRWLVLNAQRLDMVKLAKDRVLPDLTAADNAQLKVLDDWMGWFK